MFDLYIDALRHCSILLSLYDFHYVFDKEKVLEKLKSFQGEVFLDSGQFEAKKTPNLSELYFYKYLSEPWDVDLYEATLNEVQTNISDLYIVNFDTWDDIEHQTRQSLESFSKIEEASKYVLLLHPNGQFWTLPRLKHLVKILKTCINRFDILGTTEKELGPTLIQRIINIFYLRDLLNRSFDRYIPLKIFGAHDPKSVILYFISGGDIFDGLSWLRFYFNNRSSRYTNEFDYDLIREKVLSDDLIFHNILYMNRISNDLNYSLITEDFTSFSEELSILNAIIEDGFDDRWK